MKKMVFEGLGDGARILKVFVIVAIPVAMLMFHVFNQYRITKLGYAVAEQAHQHRQLIEQHRKLSIEATYQGRSERMLALAKQKFGLEPLKPEQVIELDSQQLHGASAEQASLDIATH